MTETLFETITVKNAGIPLRTLIESRLLLDKFLSRHNHKTPKYSISEDHAAFLVEYGIQQAQLTDSVIAIFAALNDGFGTLPIARSLLERSFRVLWASYDRWPRYWNGGASEWWSRWKPNSWEGTCEDTEERHEWWKNESMRVRSLHPNRRKAPNLKMLITEIRDDLQHDVELPHHVRNPNWIPDGTYFRVFRQDLHPAAHGDVATLNQEWKSDSALKKIAEIVLLANTCYCHAFCKCTSQPPVLVYQENERIMKLK